MVVREVIKANRRVVTHRAPGLRGLGISPLPLLGNVKNLVGCVVYFLNFLEDRVDRDNTEVLSEHYHHQRGLGDFCVNIISP